MTECLELSRTDHGQPPAEASSDSKDFLQFTLDALSSHLAVLDERGVILKVNAAWDRFARENGAVGRDCGVGLNYLEICDAAVGAASDKADAVAAGIRAVIAGERASFECEYPCHGPSSPRWFTVRINRFAGAGPARVVVVHEDITARKRTEDELRWKTAVLESQMNATIDGLLLVDKDGHRILHNERFTQLFHLPPALLEAGDDHAMVAFAVNQTKFPEAFVSRIAEIYADPDALAHDEIEMIDGRILDRFSSPLRDRAGEYEGRLWMFRDMTDRRRAADALQGQLALREQLAKVAANAPGIIYTFRARPDGTFCFPYASPSMERIIGVSPEAVKDDATIVLNGTHPDDLPGLLASVAESARTMQPWRHEFRVLVPGRDLFWLEGQSTPEREADGGILWHGFMSDVTERKRAEASLRESEEKFRQLAENISDVFWMGTPDFSALDYVSPGYERIWGRPLAELHADAHQWIAAIIPEDQARVIDAFQRLRQDLAEVDVEYRITRPDGSIRHIHDRGFQVRDGVGKLVRLAGIASDITERKRTAQELADHKRSEERSRRALERERELNDIKTRFVSMVSHEFRTPLGIVNTAAHLLGQYGERMSPEDRATHCEEIETAVVRMTRMMEDLLLYGRVESGKIECAPELLDMEFICQRLVGEISHEFKSRGEIKCFVAPEARRARLDGEILAHILLNLFSNALKYSSDGQAVELHVRRITGERSPSADYLQFQVTDFGIGIPAAHLPVLFQTFQRASNVGNRPGSGMGLAIVKQYVDVHHGTIRVESVEGQGTSVCVNLPVLAEDHSVKAAPASADKG